MRQLALTFCIVFYNLVVAQVDTTITDTTISVYGDLPIKKFYSANYSSGAEGYKINGQSVSKRMYDFYRGAWENMKNCKPCILMTYDMNRNLISKGVQYTDCIVGYFIKYYSNGKVKSIGHYKENPSGDWNNIFDRGFCSRADGVFTYFNETGDKLYSEYWKDGEFIKQVPEQKKAEIWKVELLLDSVKIENNQELTPKQVNEIKITPKYKNSSTEGTNITIEIEINAVGHPIVDTTISLDNFKTVNVQKMLDEAKITATNSASCTMIIYNNKVAISTHWITIKQ